MSTRIIHDLPDEITALIVQHLSDDKKTLCSLAQTCSRLQQLAEEQIYRTIRLLSVKYLHSIINAFTRRRQRIRAVQTLDILYRFRKGELSESLEARNEFNACVPHMVKLKHWHVESPYDNFRWEEHGGEEWVNGDMERFREALETACLQGAEELQKVKEMGWNFERTVGLAQLEKLVLHSHGPSSDFWDLNGFHCLFRHPSLRYLHASCFTLPGNIPELDAHVKSTPLTTLIFDECEIDPSGLLQVLRTPKALKELTLGENVHNVYRSKHCDPKLTNSPITTLEALGAVAHSLEKLTHYDPWSRVVEMLGKPRRVETHSDGMRKFHSLKFLDCDTCSFLYSAVVMSPTVAPPNLEVLRIRREQLTADLFDELPDISHYIALPSLKTLEFVQTSYWHAESSSADYICEPERLRERHAYAYKLFNAGINMKVYIEMSLRPNLIPPFLHGEPAPRLCCLYDANSVGFRRYGADDTEEFSRYEVEHNGTVISIDMPTHFSKGLPKASLPAQERSEVLPPETDQLDTPNILQLKGEVQRALRRLRLEFPPYQDSDDEDEDMFGFSDDFDEFDEEMDLEFEYYSDTDQGEVTTLEHIILQHHGIDHEMYFEFGHESQTEDEDDEEDEDEELDEDEDDGFDDDDLD